MNPPDFAGRVIGNLKLTGKLGVGGMGTVYRGEHMTLGTPYAVKILHPQFSMDKTTAERFRREAITCSKLRHPNVIFVTDFGFQDDLGIYIIMEYIEGASLRQVLMAEGPQPIGRVGRIGEQICDALDAAHRLGIVHRDLKPDNIMILSSGSQPDFSKILDFGIAQIKADDGGEDVEKLTRAGLVLGTPAYISPEQINKKAAAVGPGADIYAMGIMFYQMLTGYVPFTGQSEFEILSQHVFKIPSPVSEHRADLSGSALEKLLQRMLEKDPKNRPASMGQVRRELLDAVRELRDQGYQDAFYGADDGAMTSGSAFEVSDSGMFALNTPTPMGITNVIQQLTAKSPDSKISVLITALRGMAGLHEEVFYLALWGVLQREWLDAPLASEEFKQSNEQIKTIVKLLLNLSPTTLTATQAKVFRGLGDLFTLGDRERQRLLVVALQPLTQHTLFPNQLMPQWAQASGGTGTWSAFKAVMTTEIKLPFGTTPAKPRTASGPSPEASGPPQEDYESLHAAAYGGAIQEPQEPLVSLTPEQAEADAKGLSYKLRQDVSLKSLKNVLSHELSIFGKKKK